MALVTDGAGIVQKVEKMSVAVTPEMAGAVRAAVESGEYASTS